MTEFIVAEISKNWTLENAGGEFTPDDFIRAKFEEVIEFNRRRGYLLYTFQFHRLMTSPTNLNETIIAVFGKAE